MLGHLRSVRIVIFLLCNDQTYISQHIDGLFKFSGWIHGLRHIVIKFLIIFVLLIVRMFCTQILENIIYRKFTVWPVSNAMNIGYIARKRGKRRLQRKSNRVACVTNQTVFSRKSWYWKCNWRLKISESTVWYTGQATRCMIDPAMNRVMAQKVPTLDTYFDFPQIVMPNNSHLRK